MTPQEDDLRRALEARSGPPSPEFRTRLSRALAVRPAAPSFMPALAMVTVVVLTLTSVGILVAAGHFGRKAAVSPNRSSAPVGGAFQVSAPSARTVWALYDPDKLYRSTDAGASWQLESVPADFGAHSVISFIDDQEGWWLAAGPPPPHCQEQSVTIWHTVDSGATWRQLSATGISPLECKDGIWFSDPLHGFVTAHDPSQPPTVYSTSDGGKTWAGSTIQDPAYFQSLPGGFTLQVDWVRQFGSTAYLEAFGNQDRPDIPKDNQFVLRSADGGASWTYLTKVPSRAVVMVTETRWLDFTSPGQAMESINGGQQFHQFASDFNEYGADGTRFVFTDANTGYAVGNNGLFQRTLDGGAHWGRLAPPGLGNVAGTPTPSQSPAPIPMPTDARISAPSPGVVWALVTGQFLFRSTDQGVTWQQQNLPPRSPFSDLSFVDESDGWLLVGGPGATQCSFGGATVWQTTNAGASWNTVTQVNPPAASGTRIATGAIDLAQCKENLSFVDRQRGFLDAWDDNSPPTIYRTSDGGVTWSSSRLADPPGFHTFGAGDALRPGPVRAFGATLLVTASGMQPDGPHTYVFQSTDGGATWQYLASVPQSPSPEVELVTQTRWLKLQSALETTDAGKTWHGFTTDYNDAAGIFSAFVFADNVVGYGTVRGGIHRTLDGGSHWDLIKTSWP